MPKQQKKTKKKADEEGSTVRNKVNVGPGPDLMAELKAKQAAQGGAKE